MIKKSLALPYIAARKNLPSPLKSKALAMAQLVQSLAPISAQDFRGEPDSNLPRWSVEIRTLAIPSFVDDQLTDGLSESDSVGLGIGCC